MKQAVIDTNVLISWYKHGMVSGDEDLANTAPIFSVVTQIEALGFQHITDNEIEAIGNMLDCGQLMYINERIAEQTIRLRQQHKIKTPDAIIAATALVNDAELWTANTDDFKHIADLRLHNPLTDTLDR